MENLNEIKCLACENIEGELLENEIKCLLKQVPDWNIIDKKIEKIFKFKNFIESIEFTKKVANIAENEGHHPDIHIHWNKVKIELWTHSINGLSKNDFIVAAKINNLLERNNK